MKKNKLGVVIRQVYRKNVFSWSFFWMIMGPVLMLAVIAAVSYFVTNYADNTQQSQLAMVGASDQLESRIKDSTNYQVTFELTEDEAKTALADGDIEGYIKVDEESQPLSARFYKRSESSDISISGISQALENYQLENTAKQIGLTDDQFRSLTQQPVDVQTITLNEASDGSFTENAEDEIATVVQVASAYIISIVMLLFVSIYTSIIAQEIASEKGSRVMEIILSSISATTHFFGKLIGILGMILTQIVIHVIFGVIIYFVVKQVFADQYAFIMQMIDSIGTSFLEPLVPVLLISLAYLLIGLFTYICLAALFGSLASRTEDVQSALAPVMSLVVIGFYIGIFAMTSANNLAVRIGSLIPFFTPLVMPFRLATDTVSQSEIILSFVISIITMVIILIISSNLYKSNVLIYSDNGIWSNLKQSLRLRKNVK